ncbi:hypothetical protein KW411_16330 [Vibrio fluvialis]|nr:hypothetical protein [Vibrio fluvialis]
MSNKINVVSFYSEGYPNDRGLDLSSNKDNITSSAREHVDEVSFYTPSLLRKLGFEQYVKEYSYRGLVYKNPGMNFIGFCAWRPLIMLLELEKLSDGDILVYRDINAKKYPILSEYKDLLKFAEYYLDLVNFDVFIPAENDENEVKEFTKLNIINELSINKSFTKSFPLLIANFIIVRKSEQSIKVLNEWRDACLHDKYINGCLYGLLDTKFKWFTPEQSILSVILSNYVFEKIDDINEKYPVVYFEGRNFKKPVELTRFDYLEHQSSDALKNVSKVNMFFSTLIILIKSMVYNISIDYLKLNEIKLLKSLNRKIRSK